MVDASRLPPERGNVSSSKAATPAAASATTVSAIVPDWSRERVRCFWDTQRQLLRHIRGYQAWKRRGGLVSQVMRRWHVLGYRWWSIVTASQINLGVEIGGGLQMPHPNGIVIHPEAKIGPNCLIFQQVGIGPGGPKPGVPVLAGHVDVGAGAKILGGVVIGEHARIGANAVVIDDVPAYATVVGVPARIVRIGALRRLS